MNNKKFILRGVMALLLILGMTAVLVIRLNLMPNTDISLINPF